MSEPDCFFNGNGEFLSEGVVGFVFREIETIEAGARISGWEDRMPGKGAGDTSDGFPYQVCDLGNAFSAPDFSIVKRLGPSLPWRSLKPLTGIREVPVANWRRRDFCSASQLRIH